MTGEYIAIGKYIIAQRIKQCVKLNRMEKPKTARKITEWNLIEMIFKGCTKYR
jgi:hypothetical protein